MGTPRLIISLDFELHWGVFDHLQLDAAGRAYFDRTRALIPDLLDAFQRLDIHATWATVGLLFARNREEVMASLPTALPAYANEALNPFALLEGIGENEEEDPYHYAPSLIEKILATPGQFIGSHTYSHYYCLENGQTAETFAADLSAAQQIARQNFGVDLTSLVFPRNQYSPQYLDVIAGAGFRSYRTNPDVWFWQAQSGAGTSTLQKAARLTDHYLPLHGNSAYAQPATDNIPTGIPASRFFRPYMPKLDGYGGQSLKVNRICGEMTRAAEAGLDYHLWWHPHNLATDPDRNMKALTEILNHFATLRDKHGMQSVSMEECTTAAENV